MKSVNVSAYDQLTSGFEDCLNWHQVLHSKLIYLEKIDELLDYSVAINGPQGISMKS